MEDILTVLPFGGTFDLVQIKGSIVKKAFEHSIHRYGHMNGEFLQVSGLYSGPSAPQTTLLHPGSPNINCYPLWSGNFVGFGQSLASWFPVSMVN